MFGKEKDLHDEVVPPIAIQPHFNKNPSAIHPRQQIKEINELFSCSHYILYYILYIIYYYYYYYILINGGSIYLEDFRSGGDYSTLHSTLT